MFNLFVLWKPQDTWMPEFSSASCYQVIYKANQRKWLCLSFKSVSLWKITVLNSMQPIEHFLISYHKRAFSAGLSSIPSVQHISVSSQLIMRIFHHLSFCGKTGYERAKTTWQKRCRGTTISLMKNFSYPDNLTLTLRM